MFLSMPSLPDALGIPSTKVPISVATFLLYVVPPVACYFIFALLALTPETRPARVALWPVVALLAIRAAVSVDISHGKRDLKFLDGNLLVRVFHLEPLQWALDDLLHEFLQQIMSCIAIHTLSWAFAKNPLVRHPRPVNSSPSIIADAFDLTTNFRGHGWDWSRGLHVPHVTRPTNRIAFAFLALLSGVANAFICGGAHRAIHTFTAGYGSDPKASTIFDETLPLVARYLRSSAITILCAITAYSGLQLNYDLLTVLGVVLFGQDSTQWPPAFDSPWRATSLSEFWSCRWHQFYRFIFLTAAYPFSVAFGRAGGLIGAFLASALFHHLTMITFDSRSEMWRMLVAFGMMGPGVLAERAYYKSTGRKVGGVVGWIWTMTWLLLWGNVMAEGFVKSGMFAQSSAIDDEISVWVLIERLVLTFDGWLHTI